MPTIVGAPATARSQIAVPGTLVHDISNIWVASRSRDACKSMEWKPTIAATTLTAGMAATAATTVTAGTPITVMTQRPGLHRKRKD
jgi:hypothetical protein